MWLLGRLLPVAIGDLVPTDHAHWNNYLLLLDIMDRLFAPVILREDAGYVESLISDHHHEFVRLYSADRITPKMHYLVHTPRLILEYGPLVRHWMMQFEAKNSYFKRLASSIGNYINVPYTLAHQHQSFSCYNHLDTSTFINEKMEVGRGKPVEVSNVPESCKPLIPDMTSVVYSAKSVTVEGIHFKKPCTLLCGSDDGQPVFGSIADILVVDSRTVVFCLQKYETESYDEHFHSYVVTPTAQYTGIEYDSLKSPQLFHARSAVGKPRKKLITMKCYVPLP